MKKIYKYRPLSQFLFKELHYQELYFASYNELNDPLDLNARIEFTPLNKRDISYLIWFIFKSNFDINHLQSASTSKLINFRNDKTAQKLLIDVIFQKTSITLKSCKLIWYNELIQIIKSSLRESDIDIDFDETKFKIELDSMSGKFLQNSYCSSFSESNNNFLMWSHYATRHSGICLEFTLNDIGFFPFESHKGRQENLNKYNDRISEWNNI